MADDPSNFAGDGIDTPEPPQASRLYSDDQIYNSFLYKARLIETDYLPALVEAAWKAPLTMSAKKTLSTIFLGLFEKSVVLAREKDIDVSLWEAEIMVLSATQSFTSYDLDRPELQVIINSALEHYKKFISRSKDGWERELQNRIETSNKTENVQRIVAPKPPKRGFLSIFGGK
ncbi:MAG: hypothetical protein PHH09_13935 [Methanoregulaceae archaeon]|jgi:hypothetical protein|nr:hypothetical protein [Methanoregulaceae archaeon]MDD5050021.1 hypothetical protein [Methanoregulaceae archaeon]